MVWEPPGDSSVCVKKFLPKVNKQSDVQRILMTNCGLQMTVKCHRSTYFKILQFNGLKVPPKYSEPQFIVFLTTKIWFVCLFAIRLGIRTVRESYGTAMSIQKHDIWKMHKSRYVNRMEVFQKLHLVSSDFSFPLWLSACIFKQYTLSTIKIKLTKNKRESYERAPHYTHNSDVHR